MTKRVLIGVAAVAAATFAQVPQTESAFQQQAWLSAQSGLFPARPLEGQTGPVVGRPLSADEVRTTDQTLSDGSHVHRTETNHFYRDSQGRMATVTSTGADIYDPIAGFTYDLTFWSKTYTKSPIKTNEMVTIAAAAHYSSISSHSVTGNTKQAQRKGGGPVTEELAPEMISGTLAKGSRVTVMIPMGAIGNESPLKVVNERWSSDDLKLLVKSSNSDPRFGVTTYELKNIVQADPDLSVFNVPADYKEGH